MPFRPCVSRKLYLWVILVTLGLFLHRQSSASEEIVLKIVVNTVPKGEFFVILTADQDIQIKAEDFTTLGIKDPGRYVAIGGEQYISLKSLYPDLSFALNEKVLTLEITAKPALLGETALNLYSKQSESAPSERNSAFFNYAASYSTGETLTDFGAFDLSTEVGTRFMGFLSLSTFFYLRNPTEERFVRLNNTIIRDDPDRLRRYLLGDFIGDSGVLGSSVRLGGINISKNFSIEPYFVRHPLPSLRGTVETPSNIRIFQNGFFVREERLPPGEFVLRDIPGSASGLGQLDFVIKDAFGREERISKSYYIDSTILKKGVHDYGYSFGLKREAFGTEDFQYGDPVFLAFHDYGFSDRFNGGMSAEASKELINFGPTTTLLLGKAGVFNLTGAYSNAGGEHGGAGLFAYSFVSRRFSTRFSIGAFSPGYATVSNRETENKQKLDASIGLGVGLGKWGSVTGEFSLQKTHSDQETRRFFLSYSRQMTKNTSFFLTSSTLRGSEISDRFFAGLHVNLGGGVSGSLNHATSDDDHLESLRLQRSIPEGEGLGYRLSVERSIPDKGKGFTDGTTFLQYNSRYHIYTAEYQRLADTDKGNFSLSGGVAAIGGSLHLSRPITDSFALVRVGELKGVGVKFNNKKLGETDSKGELLLPNIHSFQDNKIEIENKDVPINYKIESVVENVAPPFRGGEVVEFKVEKLQAIIGTLFHTVQGKRKPMEGGRLKVWVLDTVVESPLGKEGEFYLENIPPGKHKGVVSSKTGECAVQIVIPESDEMMIDLGAIACQESSKAGATSSKGKGSLPNAHAFGYDKSETENATLKDEIEPPAKEAHAPIRVGSEVESKPQRHHEIIGTISYIVKGVKKSVKFENLQIAGMGRAINLPVGKGGEFYLANIPSGKFKGQAFFETGKCETKIIIPESDHLVIDLGSLTCEELL